MKFPFGTDRFSFLNLRACLRALREEGVIPATSDRTSLIRKKKKKQSFEMKKRKSTVR